VDELAALLYDVHDALNEQVEEVLKWDVPLYVVRKMVVVAVVVVDDLHSSDVHHDVVVVAP
jgi:hypothetical protein